MSERETRSGPRAFVRYDDLVADWRRVVVGLERHVGLRPVLDATAARLVDDFVDPDLRRHRTDWANVDAPAALVDLAQEVWDVALQLADDPRHEGARAALDACAERYRTASAGWAAATQDWAAAAAASATLTAMTGAATAPIGPVDPTSVPVADRAVRDVRAAELAAVLVRRVADRLRR